MSHLRARGGTGDRLPCGHMLRVRRCGRLRRGPELADARSMGRAPREESGCAPRLVVAPSIALRGVAMPDRSLRDRLLIPMIIACALFMENMDSTVLSTSLPAIAADLHEDPIALKLALTSYLLSLAVFIPASGWAADRFGARTIFRGAIVVFTGGSILCGFADSLPTFIGARIVQGLGGAMMVPVGRLVLLRSVPKHEIVQALAYLTMPALLGPILGPTARGLHHDLCALAMDLLDQRADRHPGRHPGEPVHRGRARGGATPARCGRIFADRRRLFRADVRHDGVAGRGFLTPLQDGLLVAGGVVLLAVYVRHASRIRHPIPRPHVAGDPDLHREPDRGLPVPSWHRGPALPAAAAAADRLWDDARSSRAASTFAAAAGAFLMKTTAQPILRRFGFRRVLIVNALISAGFLASYGLFTATTPWWLMFVLLLGGGFFRSLEFTSINAIAYADIDSAAMSQATSFASVVQQLSLSTGASPRAPSSSRPHA